MEADLHAPHPAILLVGATGTFGARLAEGLTRSNIAVIGIALDGGRLEALRQKLGPLFSFDECDRSNIDGSCLQAWRSRTPGLFAVVDASGPFQTSDLRLPQSAIESGLHYLDLADGRAFVASIGILDHAARVANVAVLSGASSTPALSHAVLDFLLAKSRKTIAIEVSIAPGNRAPRGLNVIRAILSTVGQPVRVFRGCRWVCERGWSLNKTIALPAVGTRRVALCETPDLDLLVERYNPAADAIFRAGLELRVLHDGTATLGQLVRLGLLASLEPWSRVLRFAADLFRPFGTDRGGMRIDALVIDASGGLVSRSWTLTAGAGEGPYVPTLPALTALKMLAARTLTWRGAAPCAGYIPYDAIAAEFSHHGFETRTRETARAPPLFRRLLGNAYDALPDALREAHDVQGVLALEGKADADGPNRGLAKIVAWLFRLPPPGLDMPVRVEMRSEDDGSETWTRIYPNVTMRSRLGNPDPVTCQIDERFGPVAIRLEWRPAGAGLSLRTIGARILGIPLPEFLRPRTTATESAGSNGAFRFDVAISLPLIGTLARYRGWLRPVRNSLN
jgi:saccharopine dehydrogenase-like NADP-dependent oxidoreductase